MQFLIVLLYSILKFYKNIFKKLQKIYKSISLPQIPPDATICDLFFNFSSVEFPSRVRSAAHSGYGDSPNGSHELRKIRKSIPLALCVHMFITLATPLTMIFNQAPLFLERDMAQWLKRGALPMSLPAVRFQIPLGAEFSEEYHVSPLSILGHC